MEEKPNNKQAALSSIESKYTNSFAGKTNYVDINGLFARLVDKVEMNNRYRLNNGYLTDTLTSYSTMTSSINNLTNLRDYLALYNIPFAYVQTPHVISIDDDSMIPFGYETNINGNSDRLLAGLQENSVNYLDLRENVAADGINNYDLFFSTDHHWTTEAAFWAHSHIINFIDDAFNEKLVNHIYSDLSNYVIEEMECNILGSHGQRTGVYFGGINKVSAISPNFETSFHVQVPLKQFDEIGNFNATMLNNSGYTSTNVRGEPEGIYFGSNTEYKKIDNLISDNNFKLLIINDSFSLPLAPFLSLYFNEIHMYDTRTNFGGSTEGFIKKLHEIQPDVVLQIRTYSNSLTAEALAEVKNG